MAYIIYRNGIALEWHLLKPRTTVIPAQAGMTKILQFALSKCHSNSTVFPTTIINCSHWIRRAAGLLKDNRVLL
jgi:hypothetical protein